ncbi:DUF1643 domain-containing protein [Tropicibacter oceani]|uniref:DUF1643 domain-containing protein n=1 Tax=Tropicibacter oceani TaxID=3058420 RepID=UPI002938D2A4|nr:DUF1643 domain-containing protein [Tropicibacter oceani]
MIERQAKRDGQVSTAWFSPCERYRYGLRRTWDTDLPAVLFIMLNPSTADEMRNDPTIERCQRRARAMGCGSLWIANLFAFRATRPQDLRRAADPEGPENVAFLRDWSGAADLTIAGWGGAWGAFRSGGTGCPRPARRRPALGIDQGWPSAAPAVCALCDPPRTMAEGGPLCKALTTSAPNRCTGTSIALRMSWRG